MSLSERQSQILSLLSSRGKLEVEDLAEHFAVSTQTIRKDLNELCEQGLARRVRGGVSTPASALNLSFGRREQLNAGVKHGMARALAARIPDGSTLMLGIGTSVAHLARALAQHRRLRVLTNNLDVAAILCEQPETQVVVVGGNLRHNDRDMVGEAVTRGLDQYRVDFGIIGAGGLDPACGLLDFDPQESDVSRAILRNAQQRVLLADRSKWNTRPMVRVCEFSQLDLLVCDRLPSAQVEQALLEQGVDVLQSNRPKVVKVTP